MSDFLTKPIYPKLSIGSPMGMITSAAKLAVHTLLPDDFEYYLCGIELLNTETGKIEYRLLWPIQPTEFTIEDSANVTIQKTAFGVVSLYNPSFTIKNIHMSGSFGRKFKVLIGSKMGNKGLAKALGSFTPYVKTGYGVTKMLQTIYEKANDITEYGDVYLVRFFNFSFNAKYYVEFTNFTVNQVQDRNMLWNYDITLKAVAPIDNSLRDRVKKKIKAGVKKSIKGIGSKIKSLDSGTLGKLKAMEIMEGFKSLMAPKF